MCDPYAALLYQPRTLLYHPTFVPCLLPYLHQQLVDVPDSLLYRWHQ